MYTEVSNPPQSVAIIAHSMVCLFVFYCNIPNSVVGIHIEFPRLICSTHARTHTHTHVHVHAHTQMYMYTHTHTHVHVHARHTHVHVHAHTHTCTCTHTHTHVHAHARTHMYMYMYTHAHTHARTHTRTCTRTHICEHTGGTNSTVTIRTSRLQSFHSSHNRNTSIPTQETRFVFNPLPNLLFNPLQNCPLKSSHISHAVLSFDHKLQQFYDNIEKVYHWPPHFRKWLTIHLSW